MLVCVKDANESLAICERLRAQFPLLSIYARAYDRTHTIALSRAGIDLSVRDTFESAVRAGREVLEELGIPPERAAAVEGRLCAPATSLASRPRKLAGVEAGMDLNAPEDHAPPRPLRAPGRKGQALKRGGAGGDRGGGAGGGGGAEPAE